MNFSPWKTNMLRIAKNTKLMLIFFVLGPPTPPGEFGSACGKNWEVFPKIQKGGLPKVQPAL